MTNLTNWKHGTKVRGVYCGVPYLGAIVCDSSRCLTTRNAPDYRAWIFEIELSESIEVFGQKRESISVWSNSDTNSCMAALEAEPELERARR